VRERKITEFELRTNICIWFPNKFADGNISLYFIHTSLQVIVCWFVICFYGNQIKISVTTATNKQLSVCISR